MLNKAEFNQLQDRSLSHMARTLYVFYLQPAVQQGFDKIDLFTLAALLESSSVNEPSSPHPTAVAHILDELMQNGLVRKQEGQYRDQENNKFQISGLDREPDERVLYWQGAHVVLPLFVAAIEHTPQYPFKMHDAWEPGPSFRDVALLAGLTDCSYRDSELRAFIGYWQTRPEARSQTNWERAFVQRLIKNHSADEMAAAAARRRFANSNKHSKKRTTFSSPQFGNATLPSRNDDQSSWQQGCAPGGSRAACSYTPVGYGATGSHGGQAGGFQLNEQQPGTGTMLSGQHSRQRKRLRPGEIPKDPDFFSGQSLPFCNLGEENPESTNASGTVFRFITSIPGNNSEPEPFSAFSPQSVPASATEAEVGAGAAAAYVSDQSWGNSMPASGGDYQGQEACAQGDLGQGGYGQELPGSGWNGSSCQATSDSGNIPEDYAAALGQFKQPPLNSYAQNKSQLQRDSGGKYIPIDWEALGLHR